MCDCEFDPYEEGDTFYGDESWHFKRTCLHCGHTWYGLHCPHDGRQNPCPGCGIVPAVVRTVSEQEPTVAEQMVYVAKMSLSELADAMAAMERNTRAVDRFIFRGEQEGAEEMSEQTAREREEG